MGNGLTLPIEHFGDSSFNSNSSSFILHNVLHVPSITKNLVFVCQFCVDNRCLFGFHDYHFSVKDKTIRKILPTGPTHDGLYVFPSTASSAPSPSTHLGERTLVAQWHHRLGHPSLKLVSTILHSNHLKFLPRDPSFQCSACPFAKSHQLPFSLSQAFYTRPLQLLAVDLWGPASFISHNGFRYYISFVEQYMHYTWFFPLKLKSDVFRIFSSFLPYVKCLFNIKLITLQTDGGGEFKLLTHLCQKLGITHRFRVLIPTKKWAYRM